MEKEEGIQTEESRSKEKEVAQTRMGLEDEFERSRVRSRTTNSTKEAPETNPHLPLADLHHLRAVPKR